MGMDVFGRNAACQTGEYFRASIWMWPPIHHLMTELCSDFLDDELLVAMAYNDGAGPDDQETCSMIAERFEKALQTYQDGFVLDSKERVDERGRFVSEEELAQKPDLKTFSPYRVSRDTVTRWVAFLRHCGGFAVW
jgi:hypothetical protein